MMALIPLTEVAHLLTIDAKTLRQWIKHSHLSLQAHPTDGRVKCLTEEQVQQLASLHGHPMTPNAASVEAPSSTSASGVQPETAQKLQLASAFPSSSTDSDLMSRLFFLETTVSTLQQQVTQLALELLKAREQTIEHHLRTISAQVSPSSELSSSKPLAEEAVGASPQKRLSSQRWSLNPAELHARSRLISRIEYGALGAYVIIHPQEGELLIKPDSQEWFDWLASLSSFRFIGPGGRFTAYRESTRSGPTRGWSAVRCVHGHRYKCYLGVTDRLTISCLEQAIATLQSHMAAL